VKRTIVVRVLAALISWSVSTTLVWADLQSLMKSAEDALRSGDSASVGSSEVASALKVALAQGAEVAVASLGRQDGFYGNPDVRIQLPGALNLVAQGLRMAGQGDKVEAFELSMNRAAEAAVPAALEVLTDVIADLTIQDAIGILQGEDDAATQYLRRVGGDTIEARIRPYIAQTTDQFGVTRQYKELTGGSTGALGGLLGDQLDVDSYVTEQATDGLFQLIAAEERRIRQNPAARTTELLRQVFGQ